MVVNNTARYRYGFDLLFSNWIFVWYLLYIFCIVPVSPKLAIIVALIINAITFLVMIYIKRPIIELVLFIMVQTVIKIIPLYTLRNIKIDFVKDFQNIIFVALIYLLWLHINKITVFDIISLHPASNLILDNLH
jgi:hypothetical protein